MMHVNKNIPKPTTRLKIEDNFVSCIQICHNHFSWWIHPGSSKNQVINFCGRRNQLQDNSIFFKSHTSSAGKYCKFSL